MAEKYTNNLLFEHSNLRSWSIAWNHLFSGFLLKQVRTLPAIIEVSCCTFESSFRFIVHDVYQNSLKMATGRETRSNPVPKFAVGENVLCYEPDPNKARVLYESKVSFVERMVFVLVSELTNIFWQLDQCDMTVRDQCAWYISPFPSSRHREKQTMFCGDPWFCAHWLD